MSKPDISIIIVNWKVKDFLGRCLKSIFANQKRYNLEIFVVDNDSRDGSLEMLETQYSKVNVIASAKNIGFGAANNLAIKKAQSDYIFLLNPDTELTEYFLENIFTYIKNNPDIDIIGPKILNNDGSEQASIRRFPDLFSQILILFKLKNILANNKFLNTYLFKDFNYNKEQYVNQIMGAAMIIRKSVFDKIGFFDEEFFIWFEEVDLCKRANKAGIKIKYFPGASVIHKGGQSFTKRALLKKQMLFNKSLLYYFFKHKPKWQTLLILILIPFNIILTLIYVIFLKSKTK